MYDYDEEIRRERARERRYARTHGEMTARQYAEAGSGHGVWTGKTSSFEDIFAAYHDYRNSQQWG